MRLYCRMPRSKARKAWLDAALDNDVERTALRAYDRNLIIKPRDDDVMPDSLEGALGEAAERAVASRAGRVLAEVYVPELFDPFSGGILANEGDQQRYWDMGDVFCRRTLAELPEGPVNFVYPDVGSSARMAGAWADHRPRVHVSSLCDRTIAREGDVATVVVCADPMAARAIPDLAQVMADSAGAVGGQLILFNPVFNNYEVGAGLTARRMREEGGASMAI